LELGVEAVGDLTLQVKALHQRDEVAQLVSCAAHGHWEALAARNICGIADGADHAGCANGEGTAATSTHWAVSWLSMASGFSQTTCLPASRARLAMSKWSWLGVDGVYAGIAEEILVACIAGLKLPSALIGRS
jgi:hypothetical protein